MNNMAHERARYAVQPIENKVKFWPVVGIIGPRQVGKSTILRSQLRNILKKSDYRTLDNLDARREAEKAPQLFIQKESPDTCLVIDEIQKVPHLFDTIKEAVDLKRIPGSFIITGSTQFSQKVGIRESLTGRIGLQRIFPLTVGEMNSRIFKIQWPKILQGKIVQAQATLNDIKKAVDKGGMPGLCFLRSSSEMKEYVEAWVETTCERDLLQFKKLRLRPELAKRIITTLAHRGRLELKELSNLIEEDVRRVRSHVEALQELFVINVLTPSSKSSGKEIYFLFDSGFMQALGGSGLTERLRVWLWNEICAQLSYVGTAVKPFHYYKTRSNSWVDFVFPDDKIAFIISEDESPHEYTLRTARAFLKKHINYKVEILCPNERYREVEARIYVRPWIECAT